MWILALSPLGLLPFFRVNQKKPVYSWITLIPPDRLSIIAEWVGRTVSALTIFVLIGALGEPHFREQSVERIGTGAHIVLLFDRSASMNANFAGSYLGGGSEESKGTIASKMLSEFVDRRQKDLFGMVAFSTSPIYVLPLTPNHEAVQSAIRSANRGKGLTNMAPAIAMGLDFFTGKTVTGSRIIVLVSDGATILKPEIQARLKTLFHQNQVRLYWIYLRTQNAPSLDQAPKNPNERTTPEFFIHRYFQNLSVPYRAYQAENPGALQEAIHEIEQLENKPMRYFEKIPRQDLSVYCYSIALICLLISLLFKLLEIRSWKS